jgi:hypothetical protein
LQLCRSWRKLRYQFRGSYLTGHVSRLTDHSSRLTAAEHLAVNRGQCQASSSCALHVDPHAQERPIWLSGNFDKMMNEKSIFRCISGPAYPVDQPSSHRWHSALGGMIADQGVVTRLLTCRKMGRLGNAITGQIREAVIPADRRSRLNGGNFRLRIYGVRERFAFDSTVCSDRESLCLLQPTAARRKGNVVCPG